MANECTACGYEAEETRECPYCGQQKCDMCDMGDEVACLHCEVAEDEDE